MNKILKYFLLTIVVIGIAYGMFYKATNPNDYRHPRDRSIQLH